MTNDEDINNDREFSNMLGNCEQPAKSSLITTTYSDIGAYTPEHCSDEKHNIKMNTRLNMNPDTSTMQLQNNLKEVSKHLFQLPLNDALLYDGKPQCIQSKQAKDIDEIHIYSLQDQEVSAMSVDDNLLASSQSIAIDYHPKAVPTSLESSTSNIHLQVEQSFGNTTDDADTIVHYKNIPLDHQMIEDSRISQSSNQSAKAPHWGKFMPEKMPVRIQGELTQKQTIKSKGSSLTQYMKDKQHISQQTVSSHQKRMQRDIERRRHREQRFARERNENEACLLAISRGHITKNSKRILLKNGKWHEPLNDRINRLYTEHAKCQSNHYEKPNGRSSINTSSSPRLVTKDQIEKCCESLYLKAVEKHAHAAKLQDEVVHEIKRTSLQKNITYRSTKILKQKIDRIVKGCSSGESVINSSDINVHQQASIPSTATHKEDWLTINEFAWILLEVGFITPQEACFDVSTTNDKNNVIKRAWDAFVSRENERICASDMVAILETVMLGRRKQVGNLHNSELEEEERSEILQQFKLNFLSRKRIIIDGDHKVNQGVFLDQTKKTNIERCAKKLSFNETFARLIQHKRSADEKAKAIRQLNLAEEMKECTFSPEVHQAPSRNDEDSLGECSISTYNKSQCNKYRDDQITAGKATACERLYGDAQRRKFEKVLVEMKLSQLEIEREEEEIAYGNCVNIVNGLSIDERLEAFRESLTNPALPTDFYKHIATMRRNAQRKEENEIFKENRLKPVPFPRLKNGCTHAIPFQFALDNKQHKNKIRKHMKLRNIDNEVANSLCMENIAFNEPQTIEIRSPANVGINDCIDAIPNGNISEGLQDTTNAVQTLIVHLAPEKSYRINLREDDNPAHVVKAFSNRCALTNNQCNALHQVISKKLLHKEFKD